MKAIVLCLMSGIASAQTWNYSTTLTGTDTLGSYQTLTNTSTPITEAFSAQLVISGSQMTYTLNFGVQSYSGVGAVMGPDAWGIGQLSLVQAVPGGFDMMQQMSPGNGSGGMNFSVGTGGVSYYSTSSNDQGYEQILLSGAGGKWVDPPTVAAPEIDPNQGIGMLTLLAGGLAVIAGRRYGQSNGVRGVHATGGAGSSH